ncbi:MAG: nitroreductase family protein [bacterium]|nr:nitroreductase family protein [bacterium]
MAVLMDIIKKRRSVRSYLDKPVEDDKIEQIIEAARLAPSACNSQCWRFVVVKDKDIKDQITKNALGGIVVSNAWAKTAPIIIVACADLSFITHRVGAGIKGIEYHLLDMGIAVEHLVLMATELGLGTCWIGWFNERAVRNILKIPRGTKVVALITLGYPEEELKEHEKERLGIEKILYWDKYGNS